MCLAVSSSIHPISAASGIDDDMGGNDKADALVRTDLEPDGQDWRRSAQPFLKPRTIRPIFVLLWHLPGQNAPTGTSKNTRCGRTAIGPVHRPSPPVTLPNGLICNAPPGGYHRQTGILPFFFR